MFVQTRINKILVLVALCILSLAWSPGAIVHATDEILKPPSKPAQAPKSKASYKKVEPYFDGKYVGEMKHHVTKYEDTLVEVAVKHDVGFVELRAANPNVDPWLPGADVDLIIPSMHIIPNDGPRHGIVINLPEMRLYAYMKKGSAPYSYPIGIGRDGLGTPIGQTTVVNKRENPTWRPTARMRKEDPTLPAEVPPGPENPLGAYIMYLGWPEYGIHSTNKAFGVGRRASSGCIRLYPHNAEELYPKAKIGTTVTVIDQPVKIAWIKDELYLEAHTSLAQASKIEQEGGVPHFELTADDMKLILTEAGENADLIDWPKVRKIIRERPGYPIVIAKREKAAEPS